MISFLDVKKCIVDTLKTTKIKVVAEEIKDSIDELKPCFFIQMTSASQAYDESLVTIYLHYFPVSKTNVELLEMLDVLNKLFSSNNILGFDVQDIRTDMYEGILRYTFDISVREFKNYFDDEIDDKFEEMENLRINKEDI